MAAEDPESGERPCRVTRREFIRIGSATVALVPASAIAREAKAPAQRGYPVVAIAGLAKLEVGKPVAFTYPDENSPAILVRLKNAAAGGVGPGNSVVAFSVLCTHKGCPVAYRAERGLLICPCHWSSFDPAKAGQMVVGQGSQALPQIRLRVEGGEVQAVGIDGLVYGRHTNIL